MTNQNEIVLNELFRSAIYNHKNKNFIEAKKLYEKILSINPSFLKAKNNLGLVFLAENDFLNAKKFSRSY